MCYHVPGQQRFRLNSPHVVAEEVESADVDDEAIVVNLTTGTYYSIRGDTILLWKAIAGGSTAEQIVAAVVGAAGSTLIAPSEWSAVSVTRW